TTASTSADPIATTASTSADPIATTLATPVVAIELVVLDMAGTTVVDDGIVERAFERAARRVGLDGYRPLDAALQYVRDTMGQSKIEVFRHLTDGDEAAAQTANREFENAYAELIGEVGVDAIPGAEATINSLRASGIKVALTTGFSPETRDAVLARLDWEVDAALSPADAGRGRPAPDLVLAALIATRASSVAAVAVVGDTISDVRSGRNAGAGLVIGVLTGAHTREQLEAAGADLVLESVRDLASVPRLTGR
ncbi:MAG: haloacid dehalogenase, partial [Glaciihabitans sp.]|nr:haloacid dehalogenase [Glaciihabitans sp.]